MTKKILCAVVSILIIFSLVGCAEIINTETEIVEVIIVDADKDPMISTGKVTIPADYDILLKYEDLEAWVDVSRDEYNYYKDLVGNTIKVNLVTTYYDDGSVNRTFELTED